MSTHLYSCEKCIFSCIIKRDYDRHMKKKKHLIICGENQPITTINYCGCGKMYKHKSGLSRHKMICKCQDIVNNSFIINLLKDNQEMKQFIMDQQSIQTKLMEQQQQQQTQLLEMLPKVCGHTTNNIKQKFNLNFFLNEQCKDAVSLCDFINSLKITLDDLQITRDKSLEDSVSTIMLRGLKELDLYKRPIHCTDQKRDVMYIKEQESWKKDDGNINLKNSIGNLSRKHLCVLKELKDSDPEINTIQTKKDEFLHIMSNICTPIAESGEKRIIKSIGKEFIVDVI